MELGKDRYTFKLLGQWKDKTGWHECPASPSGRLFFTGGVCHAELDMDAVDRMVKQKQHPYGTYIIDPDAMQAKPAGRYAEALTTPLDQAIGDLPPSGPGVTFADATSGTKPIITPGALQKAIRSGAITAYTDNGAKKYSLEQIRALLAEGEAKPSKKKKA